MADLAEILRGAESSRVLDLASIQQRWRRAEDHGARPLFENRILNRSIILKYAPRPGESADHVERRIKSTKVLFPLDRNDLSLGGFSGLVGQKDFSRLMSRHLDGSDGLSGRDDQVLALIDQLPTLDPFLLYALLKSNGIEVSYVYFQVSEADRLAIQQQMTAAFTPLVLLCFPDGAFGTDGVRAFIDKILNFEDSAEIDSLRGAFKLSPELFAVAMFAWRGIIYYKWKSAGADAALETALAKFAGLKAAEAIGETEAAGLERSRSKILKLARAAAARVRDINASYDAAFTDFVQQRQADRFRRFLISAPSLFLICGQSVAILEQIVNFAGRRPTLGPRETVVRVQGLSEMLADLERDLGMDLRLKPAGS